ncbi:hypothetical protein Sjap_010156 [Stephania japonica]|uniref:TF-B3 domain-containing protein n=1 Tax=Stephania japonica TaxID=461633 RepID=A0AAP0P4D0_9MAGN
MNFESKHVRFVVLCVVYDEYEDEEKEESSVIEISSSFSDEELSDDEVFGFKRANNLWLDNLSGDSVSPVENLHRSRQSHRSKSSTMPNLCRKNEVRMRKESNNRSIKREERVDTKVVVANRQPSSTIYTTLNCSDPQRNKLIRAAQRLKFGRPLAAVILSHTYANKGLLIEEPSAIEISSSSSDSQNDTCIESSDKEVVGRCRRANKTNVLDVETKTVVRAGSSFKTEDLNVSSARISSKRVRFQVSSARTQAYSLYEDEENEESSTFEISSSFSHDESSDEEVVVSCERARKTEVCDIECKPVTRAGSSFKTKDLNVSSARNPGKFHRISLSPGRKLHHSKRTYRKKSANTNLYSKNAVHIGEEMKGGSLKREDTVDNRVVSNSQTISSPIYTVTGYSREQRDKLVSVAEKLKLGRPLAAISLSPSAIRHRYLYFPKPFFRTFFNDLMKIGAGSVRKSGRLITYADGEIWPVEFHFCGGQVRMVGGWHPFVCHNGLAEGDVCVFEFVKTSPLIELRVSTSRPRDRNTDDDSS